MPREPIKGADYGIPPKRNVAAERQLEADVTGEVRTVTDVRNGRKEVEVFHPRELGGG